MVNEIKNPIPTLKRNGSVSLLVVAILYMLCNIAYFAVVPKEEFAGTLICRDGLESMLNKY